MKKSWIIGMAMLALAGCYYDNEEELYPNSGGSTTTTMDTVSYSTTIAPMMVTNCTTTPGCHISGGTSPNLTTHQGVANNRDLIKERAVTGPNWMPASGPMSKADRDNLGKWIDAGAPNN